MTGPTRTTPPAPFETPWGDGAIRGYLWSGDANLALLVHAPGADLDAWSALPETLASEGYTVLMVDLPGHGLSDDPWEPQRLSDVIATLSRLGRERGYARCLVAAAGDSARDALAVTGIDALAALSPSAPVAPPKGATPPSLILVGGEDKQSAAAADGFFRATRGWTVSSTFGTSAQSTDLLRSNWSAHVIEQIAMFFRDYRVARQAPHPTRN